MESVQKTLEDAGVEFIASNTVRACGCGGAHERKLAAEEEMR
jgi:hypothetical protein